jgi:excinuclease ABC subunit C
MQDESGTEIYVGKAKNLRKRVSSYFQKKDHLPKEMALIENISDFDYIETESEVEALLLESRLIKDLHPKYNFMLKNNEVYPYAEITMSEDFPRILVTRKQHQNNNRYFGPFTSATELRAVLNILGRIFKFRTCNKKISDKDPKRKFAHPCLNYHINRCSGPCAAKVSKTDYRKSIASLLLFFGGKRKDLIKEMEKEMKEASKFLHFEKAAELRDCISALEKINQAPPLNEQLAPAVPVVEPESSLKSLQKALGIDYLPRRIEGIDIANLQGKEVVGSLVTFIDGLPFKDQYRRFKIKTVEGQDDFACIAEVVKRRYSKLKKDGSDMPDIILIDGGKGQLSSAREILDNENIEYKNLMSLAKEDETPFVSTSPNPLPLSKRSAGLKLLMYVRDEAHRFAQHYHHILRKKAMFK